MTTYTTSEGDWDTITHYEGPSLWLAGLALAKARRDARRCWMGGIGGFWVHSSDDEEALCSEFLEGCEEAGSRRAGSAHALARKDEVTCRAVLRILATGGNITGSAWEALERRGYAARVGFNTPSLTRKGWDAHEAAK